ncbi:MAG: PAS domain-containing protein [Rhodoferax sp.]
MPPAPHRRQRHVWLVGALLAAWIALFAWHIALDGQIAHSTRVRLYSTLLAEEMRQSSEELARLARNHVATGERQYQDQYHRILDIREGRYPRSLKFLTQVMHERPGKDLPVLVSLLELLRRAGVTATEFELLAQAKNSSDKLALTESAAMALVDKHPGDRSVAGKARAMLYDQDYQSAQSSIMNAIDAFYQAVDRRTQGELQFTQGLRQGVRALLVLLVLGLGALLLCARRALRRTLGERASTLLAQATRLGQGDTSAPITPASGDHGSITVQLARIQQHLRQGQRQYQDASEARTRAEREANDLMQTVGHHAIVSITDAHGSITFANSNFCHISGYSQTELLGQNHRLVKSAMQSDAYWVKAWNTIANGTPWRDVLCNRAKDGHLYWVDAVITPLRDEAGHITRYICLGNDLSAFKQAQQALESERARLSNLIAGTRAGTWEINLQTQQATVNARWAAMYGFTLEEVGDGAMQLWQERIHPDDLPHAREMLRRHCDGHTEFYECEARVRHKDGHWVWQQSRGKLVARSADGRPLWLYGMDLDVTESKHTQSELQATATRLQDHVSFLARAGRVAGIGRWQLDLQDWGVEWSEQTCHIMDVAPGHKPDFEDMLGFFAASTQETLRAAFATAAEAGKPWDMEVPVVTAMGRHIWVRCAAEAQYTGGQRTRLVGIFQDITQRHRLEDEIRAKNELMRNVLEHIPVGLTVMDGDLQLVLHNGLFRELLDLPEALFTPPVVTFESIIRYNALRGEYGEGDPQALVRDIVARARLALPHQFQRARGERTIEVRGAPMPGGGFVTTYADISELKRAMDAAQDASHSKSQFVANMSHEIRTPMNAILGLLRLLQNTELQPRQLDYVTKTEGAARSLLGLINDILDFSKMEAGRMELDPQSVRIDRLLRELAVILSASVGNKPLEVLFDLDERIPPDLVVDSMRLQQILLNLAGNAIKFTAQGEVVLRMELIGLSEPLATVRFSVRDTGIGIPTEKLAHVFEDFAQAEGATTRRYGGTGLGLSISRRLVSLMGGHLQACSTPGQGSEFHFTLALPVDADSPRPSTALPPELSELQVLVVDDNTTARNVLARTAQYWNWQVESASSGEAAVRMVRERRTHMRDQRPFDIILLDSSLPEGMDVWQTLQALRGEYGEQAHMAGTILLSAHGREGLEQRSAQEQAALAGILVKPFTAAMLLDAVADARCGRRRLRSATRSDRGAQRLQGLRLLVAEDNPINQQVASELLQSEGAHVELASNGKLALRALQSAAMHAPFDAVLMDLQMPEMDGFAATGAIRQQAQWQQLPIIAMTANALDSDREACLAAGMNDHIGKPFDLEHLVQVLLDHTLRQSPRRASSAVRQAPTPAVIPPSPLGAGSCDALDIPGALARLDGNSALLRSIVHSFLLDASHWDKDLAQLIARGDHAGAARLLHTIKGLAATVGAQGFAAYARHLESLFKSTVPFPTNELPDQLRQAIGSACHQLRQALIPLPAPQPDGSPSPPGARPLVQQMRHLAELLQQSNLEAMDAFAQLPALAPLPADLAQDLRQAMARFDFERAAAHCETAIGLLSTPPASNAPD